LPSAWPIFIDEKWYLYAIAGIPLLFVIRWLFYEITNGSVWVWLLTLKPTGLVTMLRQKNYVFFGNWVRTDVIGKTAKVSKVPKLRRGITSCWRWHLWFDVEQDLQPNRLGSRQRLPCEFIEGRLSDRIGLVVFREKPG
jgi:hypothetical protein